MEFTVTIPHDGGGVGSNWTLAFDGFTVCDEILTSGRIIVRYAK